MAHPYSRRNLLTAAAAVGATLGMPPPASAQSFPDKTKPIKGLCPFPAGSTADTVGRAYAQAMSEILGANVVIENRPGAEGVIGLQAAKTAPADGYTMLFTSLSTQVVNPHLFKRLTYDPLKDFIPLAGTIKSVLLMNVGPSLSSFKSAQEFIEAAKANPGKYSCASVSATTRLAGQMLAKAAGIKLLNVPYKNWSDLTSDLLSGRVDILVADGPAVVPYLKLGMRSLAAAASTRVPSLPEVPTLQEQGVPGPDIVGWHAAYVPAKTPAAVVTTLRDAVRQAAKSRVVKDYFSTFGVEPLDLASEEFAAFQRAEFDKWGEAVREAGLQGTL